MSSKKTFELKGLETFMKNMEKEVSKIEGATQKGLLRAAIHVRREMDKTSPKIPVDTGNLRASGFIITLKGDAPSLGSYKGVQGSKVEQDTAAAKTAAAGIVNSMPIPAVVMGFGANYAHWVHENVDHVFKRQGSGAKFFEMALKNNKKKVLQIIADNAQIQK